MICSLFGTSERFFDVLTKIKNLFMNLFDEWVIISENWSISFYLLFISNILNKVEEAKEMEK